MSIEYNQLKTHDEIESQWVHPWNIEKFDEHARDNRFFSIVIISLLYYLDNTIKMYDKPVRHFILHTGKEYLYQENNGYEFKMGTTTGEDYPYFHKPRGVVRWEEFTVDARNMSSPCAAGLYERLTNDEYGTHIKEFQSEIRILPITMPVTLTYVLSNFNESIVMAEQILTKFAFTRYFSYSYLGKIFQCSVEFPESQAPGSAIKVGYDIESKNRELELKLELKTTFPVMFEDTEIDSSKIIISSEWINTIGRTTSDIEQRVFENNIDNTENSSASNL